MLFRKATNAEIIAEARIGRYHYRVQYEHYTREIYNPRAKNGVSHRRFSRSKIRDIDGVPHVQYKGELEPVIATHITLDNGATLVARVRLVGIE